MCHPETPLPQRDHVPLMGRFFTPTSRKDNVPSWDPPVFSPQHPEKENLPSWDPFGTEIPCATHVPFFHPNTPKKKCAILRPFCHWESMCHSWTVFFTSTPRKDNMPSWDPFATERPCATHGPFFHPNTPKRKCAIWDPFATESPCATHGPSPRPGGWGGRTDHKWHMDSQWQRGSQMAHYHLLSQPFLWLPVCFRKGRTIGNPLIFLR